MQRENFFQNLTCWTVIGTNFTKADTQTRSSFAITHSGLEGIYASARKKQIKDFLVLSTCNRTEFYAFASFDVVKGLVMETLSLDEEAFGTFFYAHVGIDATRHFFRVAAGLDSQIIGDYEIVGQVKKAVQLARDNGLVGTLMDRVSNYAFQASKEIKAKTNLSNGKYSVSFAAAELIRSQPAGRSFRNILIVGAGEIGQALARNLNAYSLGCTLTLTNRTVAHAQILADELHSEILPFENFAGHLDRFDVVITTAESDDYLIWKKDLTEDRGQLFLDLSMPQTIEPQIKSLRGVKHYSIDEISAFHNELMKQRYLEIPKAGLIIENYLGKLFEWHSLFQHAGIIASYKEKMSRIIHNGGNPKAKIDKRFSGLILQMKAEGYRGCSVIQTVTDLIAVEK